MSRKIIISPITRINGPMSVEVEIENNKITDAKSSGLQFRGFEKMIVGRPPLDAVYFTERICGICSSAHGLVSSLALEKALNVTPDLNGVRVRDFGLGADFLQNNIRQICLFSYPDYAKINMVPGDDTNDYRLPAKITRKFNKDYIRAVEVSKLAHEMLALIGGKAPHNHGIFVGGTTANLDASKIIRLKSILKTVYDFIANDMMEDVYTIARYYPEYFKIGGGSKNLMTFGLFDDLNYKDAEYVYPSIYINGQKQNIDVKAIAECNIHSWYIQNSDTVSSSYTEVNVKRPGAYTFVKAPRYNGMPVQVGPLARMILSGNYNFSISTMDRLVARALETKKIADTMTMLLDIITPTPAVQAHYWIPDNSYGLGMKDAVRGTLMHSVRIQNGLIADYNIITPSAWNLSPTDINGRHGPLEDALIGTIVVDENHPVEIGRTIRSFDPCISCATHVYTSSKEPGGIKANEFYV